MHISEPAKNFAGRAIEYSFIALANETETASRTDLLKAMVSTTPGKASRLMAAVRFANSINPDVTANIVGRFIDTSAFPMNGDIAYLSKGGEHTVFESVAQGKKMVIKVNRSTIGMSLDKLQQKAESTRTDYQEIKEKFDSIPGFILPEQTLIMRSHVRGWAAVATIQEEVEGEDFFDELPRIKLIEQMRSSRKLYNEVLRVTGLVTSMYRDGRVIDLLGARNMLKRDSGEGKSSLVFIDPHTIFSAANTDTNRSVRLQDRISYMEGVLAEAA